MAAKATRKEISFDRAGMLNFRSMDEALKYFSEPKNGARNKRAISRLFNKSYELKVGSLSINMAAYLESPKVLDGLKGSVLINKTLAEKVKIEIEKWINAKNGKDISNPIREVNDRELLEAQQKQEAVKTDLSNETL